MLHRWASLTGSSLCLLLAAGTGAFAQEHDFATLNTELSTLNSAINNRGAKWVAAETSLSQLSREDFQKRVGTSELKIDAKPMALLVLDAPPPQSLDWRDNNGRFVTAVKDQQKCGACWAFAMTGALESYMIRTGQTPTLDLSLSEQVLVSCDKQNDGCNGGHLDPDYLVKWGLPSTNEYPYTSGNGQPGTCPSSWPNFNAHKIGSWGSVPNNVDDIKAALAAYGPLPSTLVVYEDFKHYKSGVYSYVSGFRLGTHAVLIVGFDDNGQYFIVKNSWGKDWGEKGYFRIAYSEIDGQSRFGLSTIAFGKSGPNYDTIYTGMADPAKFSGRSNP